MIIRNPPLVFLLALGFAAASHTQEYPMPGTTPRPEASQTRTDDTPSPGQIAANPDRYIGRKVTVRNAEIEDVHGQQVFTLDEDRLGAGPDVTVIIPKIAAQARVAKDDRIDVQGTVRKFVATEIKRDYDWFDVTPSVQTELEGRPVIIADSVKTTKDGRELVSGAVDTGKQPARTEPQPEPEPEPEPQPERERRPPQPEPYR